MNTWLSRDSTWQTWLTWDTWLRNVNLRYCAKDCCQRKLSFHVLCNHIYVGWNYWLPKIHSVSKIYQNFLSAILILYPSFSKRICVPLFDEMVGWKDLFISKVFCIENSAKFLFLSCDGTVFVWRRKISFTNWQKNTKLKYVLEVMLNNNVQTRWHRRR